MTASFFLAAYVVPTFICVGYVVAMGLRRPAFPVAALLMCLVPVFNLAVTAVLVVVGLLFLALAAISFVSGGLSK